MTVRITINDRGVRDAISRLKRLNPTAQDRRDIMQSIAGYLLNSTQRNFEKETDPTTGKRWQALSQTTLLARAGGKRRAYGQNGNLTNRAAHIIGSARALRDSSRLFRSIHRQFDSDKAIVGTNVIYAAVHQFGSNKAGRNGNVKIPARPFLGISTEDGIAIGRIVDRHIGSLARSV